MPRLALALALLLICLPAGAANRDVWLIQVPVADLLAQVQRNVTTYDARLKEADAAIATMKQQAIADLVARGAGCLTDDQAKTLRAATDLREVLITRLAEYRRWALTLEAVRLKQPARVFDLDSEDLEFFYP